MKLLSPTHSLLFYSLFAILGVSCRSNAPKETPGANTADSSGQAMQMEDSAAILPLNHTGDKVLIQFRPVLGKVYTVENDANFASTQIVTGLPASDGGSDTSSSITSAYAKLRMTAKGRDEGGNYKIELVETDAKMSVNNNGEKMDYVAGQPVDDPQADMMRKVYDCLLNSPMSLTMNGHAEILDVNGLDAITRKIKKIVGDSIPDEYLQVGDPSENIENLFIIFPDTAIRIGDSWQKTIYTDVQGTPIILKNVYTLTDRKDGVAYVRLTAEVYLNKEKFPKEMLDQLQNLKFSGFLKGNAEVDENSGWTKKATVEQTVITEQSANGQTARSTMHGNVQIRLVE